MCASVLCIVLGMTEIRFYHLMRTQLEAALPKMLEVTLSRGQRAVVMTGGDERSEQLAAHLWTYDERGFLPHGTSRDGYAGDQPIWITQEDENPNLAQVLFLTDGAQSEKMPVYDLVAILFDGRDETAVAAARVQWTEAKAQGHTLTYWQQTGKGWEKKAEA